MQAGMSSPPGARRKVRRRHRHSGAAKWVRRNAPHVFLYLVGAAVALALTYWLVRSAEHSPGQGTGMVKAGSRAIVAANVPSTMGSHATHDLSSC
jgi:hypothetical protein